MEDCKQCNKQQESDLDSWTLAVDTGLPHYIQSYLHKFEDDDVEAARVRESDGGAAGAGAQEEEEEGGEGEEGPDGDQDHDQQPQQVDGE